MSTPEAAPDSFLTQPLQAAEGLEVQSKAMPLAEAPKQAIRCMGDLPPEAIEELRYMLAGLPPLQTTQIALQDMQGNWLAFLAAKDQEGRIYSTLLRREPKLETQIFVPKT